MNEIWEYWASSQKSKYRLNSQLKSQPRLEGLLVFPYDAIVETDRPLGTRLLKLRTVIDCDLKCCTIGIGFNGAETNCWLEPTDEQLQAMKNFQQQQLFEVLQM